MTERPSGAGWRTAALVGPAAAAVLAVTTGWAMEHQPAAASSAAPTPVAPEPSQVVTRPVALDRTDLALQQRALTERARVVRLTKALRRLRAHTEAVTSAPLGVGPGPAPATTGGVSVAAAPVPAPAAPRPAAPAPTAHTSTGAS
jgi:hypothetical protein